MGMIILTRPFSLGCHEGLNEFVDQQCVETCWALVLVSMKLLAVKQTEEVLGLDKSNGFLLQPWGDTAPRDLEGAGGAAQPLVPRALEGEAPGHF